MTDPQIPLLWAEMQAAGDDAELEAAAAAFALIACVDHDVSSEEVARFRELIPADGRGTAARLVFDEVSTALLRDFGRHRSAAFSRLESVYGDAQAAARVLRIAQMAVVADDDIDEAEEALLAEIAAALGAHEAPASDD